MIRPPGVTGVAFSEAIDGDLRGHPHSRAAASRAMNIPSDWAWTTQVHGENVVRASRSGSQGEADALWTTKSGLPIAVFTADCFGVAFKAEGAAGVAHAGWRGVAAGVVSALREEMTRNGFPPLEAHAGPGIGPCCFEVGPEVAEKFAGFEAKTSWGATSVDLMGAIGEQLGDIPKWTAGGCTHHEQSWFSHRRDQTPHRMATIAWVS